jgi:type II secretory pathway pseudopilin PulG
MRVGRYRRTSNHEGGYVLLGILFALTILIIAMAAEAPRVTTALRRTREDELIHRGQQYSVAIRRFYKRFGRYPSNIDQLENTNSIRFLRRRYLDPLTGKDDWAPIQFGQARPSLGFFGQKVTTTGGLSPSGPGLGPSSFGSGLAGPSNPGTGPTTSAGTNPANPSGTSGPNPTGTPSASPAGAAGNPLSTDQLKNRTFGGGAIVGVTVPSEKESLKQFQQKNHYNEWQFVYDPTLDPTLRGAGAAGTAPGPGGIGAPGAPGTGQNRGAGGVNTPMTGPGTTTNPH